MNSRLSKKYKIHNKHRYSELYNFAMQYKDYKSQLDDISFLPSPSIDAMPKCSDHGDPTSRTAIKYATLLSKIELIERCAKDADHSIWKSVLFAVTNPHITYEYLYLHKMIYCGRDKYYIARQKFYWLLDQRKP